MIMNLDDMQEFKIDQKKKKHSAGNYIGTVGGQNGNIDLKFIPSCLTTKNRQIFLMPKTNVFT